MTKKIFIVDDDINITNLIAIYLEKEKYTVYEFNDSKEALDNFIKIVPDLLIIDIMMPDMDGFDLLKNIRKISDASVIMLSAKGETFDKVLALELGADDYIVKPYEMYELLARVKAILRRSKKVNSNENIIALPNLIINLSEYKVKYHNESIEMPKKEFELLVFLVENKNQVFTRDQLLSKIWSYDYLGGSRTVDVHIKRLREKFNCNDDLWEIKTIWGVGYKFEMK